MAKTTKPKGKPAPKKAARKPVGKRAPQRKQPKRGPLKAAKPVPGQTQGGRPSRFTPDAAYEVLRRMSAGESLKSISRDPAMPARATVFEWLLRSSDDPAVKQFKLDYQQARISMIECHMDDVVEIADDGTNDFVEKQRADGSTYSVFNPEAAIRSKLRCDVRKWFASKLLPDKYGESATLKHTNGTGTGPAVFQVDLTSPERQQIEMEVRAKIAKENAEKAR